MSDILLYHAVAGKNLSTALSNGQTVETAQGQSAVVKIKGDSVMINNAIVVAADLTAKNGVVHVIDTVLMPQN